jgi:hypothetical protein
MMDGKQMTNSGEPAAGLDLVVERWWPFVAAFAMAGGWLLAGTPFPQQVDGLYGTSATVASVFAGFVGAAGAIILTIKDTPLFKELSRHGYAQAIVNYLRDALFVATAFATVSLAGFLIASDSRFGLVFLTLFRMAWVSLAMLSICTFIRASRILFLLLKQSTV